MTLDEWAANGGAATDADRSAYLAAWSEPERSPAGSTTTAPRRCIRQRPDRFQRCRFGSSYFTSASQRWSFGERDAALLTGNLDGLEEHVDNLRVVRIPGRTGWCMSNPHASMH